jgi:hypothetical protein
VVVYSTSMWDIKQKLDVGSRAINIFVAGNRKLYALTESGQVSIFDLDDPERNMQLVRFLLYDFLDSLARRMIHCAICWPLLILFIAGRGYLQCD